MTPLLTLSFWFGTLPPPFMPKIGMFLLSLPITMVFVGALALLFTLRAGTDKLVRRAVARAGRALLNWGIVGLLLFLFSFERVPFLSMRFFWLLWAVWIGVQTYKMWRYASVDLPAVKQERAERDQYEKWLPKKKS
jgi:hypothetical protein